MSVVKLTTKNFRNLAAQQIEFHPKFNFIIGDNGSGKSSLLESVFYLAHGKSYRAVKAESLVTHKEQQFVVSIKDNNNNQLGVSKNLKQGITQLKVNGQNLYKLSDLAKNIAVQIVTPESFRLFFGGPKDRRKFVDLGMFHVKHEFSGLWKDFSRVLKQRNACLKQKVDRATLQYWTNEFVNLSVQLSKSRQEYVTIFEKEFNFLVSILLPDIKEHIEIEYYQGWNSKKNLNDILEQNIGREIALGFSLYGAQKFDLKFLIDGSAVELKFSRGQQKLFLLALTFAQTKLIEQVNRVKPILLIDDIGAELDIDSRKNFFKAIKEVDCQVVVTAIDKSALEPLLKSTVQNNNTLKMFHVKHGRISEVSE